MFCEVCEVECNSLQSYETHCKGRKHLNKVKQCGGGPAMADMNPMGSMNRGRRPNMPTGPQMAMMMSNGYPIGGAGETVSFDNPMTGHYGNPMMPNCGPDFMFGNYNNMQQPRNGMSWWMNSGNYMDPQKAMMGSNGFDGYGRHMKNTMKNNYQKHPPSEVFDQMNGPRLSSIAEMLSPTKAGDGSAYYSNPLVSAAMAGGLPMQQDNSMLSNTEMPPVLDPLPQAILDTPWTKHSRFVYCEVCEKVCLSIALYFVHCQCKTHIKKVEFLRGTGRTVPDCSTPMVSRRVALSAGVKLPPGPPGSAKKKGNPDGSNTEPSIPTPSDFTRINFQQLMSCVRTAIGEDYIEELKSDSEVRFRCKLCNIQCVDVKARDVHLCGKRHRSEYRRQVDPSLDIKQKKRKITPPPPSSGISAKRRERKRRKLMEQQTDSTMDCSNNVVFDQNSNGVIKAQ